MKTMRHIDDMHRLVENYDWRDLGEHDSLGGEPPCGFPYS